MICINIYIFLNIVLEFFPISSSGHGLLISRLAQYFGYPLTHSCNISVLDYLLHGPTLVVLGIFFKKRLVILYQLLKQKPKTFLKLIYFGGTVECMTLFFYVALIPTIKLHLLLWQGFFITTLLLWSLPLCSYDRSNQISLLNGFVLGCAQGIALIPGISRFGITFVAGRWLGFSSYKAFEISFLIEAPISLAAVCKGYQELSPWDAANLLNFSVGLTMLVAGFFSWSALTLVQGFILKNNIWKVSYYLFFVTLLTYFFL